MSRERRGVPTHSLLRPSAPPVNRALDYFFEWLTEDRCSGDRRFLLLSVLRGAHLLLARSKSSTKAAATAYAEEQRLAPLSTLR